MFVKICGTTSEDDALLAVALGADAVGFIFAPSKRQISPQRAADIAKRLPPEVLTVGVFQNELPSRVVEIVNRSRLGAAQLHGHETPAEVAEVKAQVPRVMKVFVAGRPELGRADEWGTNPILVDAATGGSGEAYDWSLAREAPAGLRVLLAGGLHSDNVVEAIRAAAPWGVDVATGVEREPGRKDPAKLRAFITAARSVPRRELLPPPGVDANVDAASEMVDDDHAPYDWRADDQ